MYSISVCKTPKARTLFERVPELLHKTDPAFIPPFPGNVAKYLTEKSPFNRLYGEIIPFIAYRDGKPVGRIAAIINRAHNERYQDKTGFFGFFDCANDPEISHALFEKAAETLRAKGKTSIRGPYNPSINDECGLLAQGFDVPPCIGLTWNPSYYPSLVEKEGMACVCTSFGYLLPLEGIEPAPRLKPIVERTAKRSNVKLRPIKLNDLPEELKIVHEVYNATLERNWGFVPITMDDLLGAANDLKATADPEMILIAEMNGENAGVALSLPNFNEILAKSKNTPHWLRLLHIVWLMKTYRIQEARQVVYGISPRYRDKGGLHAWLLFEQFTKAAEKFHHASLGWIQESNKEIIDNAVMLGAIQRQKWKIYEKAI